MLATSPTTPMLADCGPIRFDLDRAVELVREIPSTAWEQRVDPESDQTYKVRDASHAFPRALLTLAETAGSMVLGPGTVNRVVLSKVPSRSGIDPHTDDFGEAYRGSLHCHLPLISHPSVLMGGPDGERHMTVGHLYTMDATQEHWVTNPSAVDRVHLLFAFHPTRS